MAEVDQNLVGARAWCNEDGCDWDTAGKNAMGNASRHANATGHEVEGELEYMFEAKP